MKQVINNVLRCLLCFTACLPLTAMPAAAETGKGRFTLLPELGLYETFRSNIYLTGSDKKSDFITTVVPGIGLRYRFGDHNLLSVNYRVAFLNFARYSSNDYQDHRANGLLNLVAPGGVQLTFGDSYVVSTLERVGPITRQRPFHYNTGTAAASYAFTDRWRAEGHYVRDDQSFLSSLDRFAEYTNNLYGAMLYYRFLPHTSGLVEYDYQLKDFVTAKLSDHHDQLVYAGVAFEPGGKLKGSFKAGYSWKQFNTSVSGRNNSPRNWVMAGQVIDQLDSRTKLTLDALRALADDIDIGNASFVNTLASLTIEHGFTEKVGGMGALAYRRGDYIDRLPDPITGARILRTDNVWIVGAAGFYNIQKWLQVRLEYQYQDKASNMSLYSYTEHRAIFRLVFAL